MITNQSFLGGPLGNAGSQRRVKHFGKQCENVNSHDTLSLPVKITSPRPPPLPLWALLFFFRLSSFFGLVLHRLRHRRFGLPGLGKSQFLCSNPFFFSSDETVSDGTAPTSNQCLHRSSLATNVWPRPWSRVVESDSPITRPSRGDRQSIAFNRKNADCSGPSASISTLLTCTDLQNP